jgi:FkbM family methyltransferase
MKYVALNENISIVAARDSNYFMVNRLDYYIGAGLELYGEYSFHEAAFLTQLIKPKQTIVEVGANIGAHTIVLAKAVGPTGKVIAFEPQPACYALLQAQIALNQIGNITAYNEGVGSERTTYWVPNANYAAPGNFGGIALTKQPAPNSQPVDVVTLDERLRNVTCSLIKIDVEGMEEDVIRGARKCIRRNKPFLYIENDRIENSESLLTTIFELGYRIWWHITPYYNSENFFRVKNNVYGNTMSFNMVCFTESLDVMNGLREIKSPRDPHPLRLGQI